MLHRRSHIRVSKLPHVTTLISFVISPIGGTFFVARFCSCCTSRAPTAHRVDSDVAGRKQLSRSPRPASRCGSSTAPPRAQRFFERSTRQIPHAHAARVIPVA
jgi:hypothetical protein